VGSASGSGGGGGGANVTGTPLMRGPTAAGSRDLPIKWDPALGFHVPGLKMVPCVTVDRMIEVSGSAERWRVAGELSRQGVQRFNAARS
jgi:hypothetical protein